MTRLEEIHQLFEFNAWAMLRTFEATAALTAEEFSRDLGNSFPTIRDTLIHTVGGEWVWLMRWKGTSPTAFPSAEAIANHAAVVRVWTEINAERDAWRQTLTAASLDAMIAYRTFAGVDYTFPLWQMLRHQVNHSSYHRGQVATMLRQLGYKPLSTDLILMYQERQKAEIRV
jgi:uncharacterized damage-inducible protein DinB